MLHQHLIKCGGTTANNFISTKFQASKSLDAGSIRNLSLSSKNLIGKPTLDQINQINLRLAKFRMNGYSFVHGHSPLALYAGEDFFKFIILRNPVNRVVSQIKDWKRLNDEDLKNLPYKNRMFKIFAKTNTIDNVVLNWNVSELSKHNLSNMQTRLVFKAKMGPENELQSYSEKDQIKIAKEGLLAYDLIGITEDYNKSANELSFLNKWCPPKVLTKLNSTKEKEIDKKTIKYIEDLNRQDIELYEEALRIKAINVINIDYSIEYFEKHFAEERTKVIAPIYNDNTYLFDFNMPIIGNGFHFRDAVNTSECAVWTGPSRTTSLFIPVLAQCDINFILYIKGYSDKSIEETIKIEIDGEQRKHKFQQQVGLASILIARHITKRNFLHVKIHIDRVYKTEKDERQRGISLLKYGYSCNI